MMAVLFEEGQVVEVRILGMPDGKIRSGYFNDAKLLAAAAMPFSGQGAVYATLNPVNPALIARANNRLQAKPKSTTGDADILCRRWLPIDFDPVRPADISSTDAEHETALARARACRDYLRGEGWPEPILADSGNGAHLLYRTDLPNTPESLKTVENFLKALGLLFGDDSVDVDRAVGNAARIWKLYGTLAIKGDDLPDRPHRMSKMLDVPEVVEVVDPELLTALANSVPMEPAPPQRNGTGSRPIESFDIDTWIESSGLSVVSTGPYQGGGRKWILNPCPWNSAHTNKAAFIIQFPSGAIAAGCRHNGCIDNHWPELRKLVDPSWGPYEEREGRLRQTTPDQHASVGLVGTERQGLADKEWPEPQPLPDILPAVEPFELALLPEAFRPWIQDIAERMQCPVDFPAIGAMVALSAVVGRQLAIRPKAADDWAVVPNLWGAVVGRPGLLKTPALQEVRRPLDRLEAKAREVYEDALLEHEAHGVIAEAQQKDGKEQVRKAVKTENTAEAQRLALKLVKEEQPPPARRRYIIHDPTVEKLGEILRDNPRGVLIFRDEFSGFLRTMDREGHEADRAFYLEAWNGDSRFSYDRIGRGTIDIEAACVSLLGGIQPGPLSVYIAKAAGGGSGDDGLVQRFQLIVWPDSSPDWVNVDCPPDAHARSVAYEVFKRLDDLDMAAVGATTTEDGGLPFLRFTPAAQEVFTEWRTELEHRLRGEGLPPMLEAHLAKYRSLIPSLALLIHLTDAQVGPVGLEALRRACGWGDYLESHARRVYAPALAPAAGAAQALADRIQRGDLGQEFAFRDVQRQRWSGLSSRDEIAQGLDLLEALDWIRTVEETTPGRPKTRYVVNPRLSTKERDGGQVA